VRRGERSKNEKVDNRFGRKRKISTCRQEKEMIGWKGWPKKKEGRGVSKKIMKKGRGLVDKLRLAVQKRTRDCKKA